MRPALIGEVVAERLGQKLVILSGELARTRALLAETRGLIVRSERAIIESYLRLGQKHSPLRRAFKLGPGS